MNKICSPDAEKLIAIAGAVGDHVVVTDSGYPADCVNTGLTDGAHCSVCNRVLSTQTQIPVINHTFDNDQDESCNVCNFVRVLNCNHAKTVMLAAVSPTCTAGGLTEGRKCFLCEEILTEQTGLAPLGHAEVIDPAVAATCTADGKTEGKHCANCNTILLAPAAIAAKGHTYSVQNVAIEYLKADATCLSPAIYYYSCTCGEKGEETFTYGSTIAHQLVDVPGYPAGCTTTGLTDGKQCSLCLDGCNPGKIPVRGHIFTVGDPSPTCLDCGYEGTVIVQAPDSLFFGDNTFRIDSCTYAIKPLSGDRWEIFVTINGTNISSSRSYLSPDFSLRYFDFNGSWTGVRGVNYINGYVEPNESATCGSNFTVPNYQDVFKLEIR